MDDDRPVLGLGGRHTSRIGDARNPGRLYAIIVIVLAVMGLLIWLMTQPLLQ